ncbi:L2 [Gammapapillomavirus 14]|uniref:Minor capsid protein L2 n=1 Tax=Gammapapillomavirus 14 TaxID=1513259 RepID=A0A2D2ALR2_9PAPI|nr:L2 [Gammapapillomavirus 14]
MSLKRKKRASPQDLYRRCAQGGDCIPDVQNKYENTTIADWLLKIFGSVIYLGNLGIGTGRGTGGSFGYRPFGSAGTGRPAQELPIARPNVVIDPITPSSLIPVEPGAPSIVPLVEGTPDIGFAGPDAGPTVAGEDIELYTLTTPTTDVAGVGGGPSVITTEELETAIIDAHPAPATPKQVIYDSVAQVAIETHVNPFYNPDANNLNIYVDPLITGDTVGGSYFEDIPLERLDLQSFEVEEPPTESTPTSIGGRLTNRARDLYSRFIQQVPVNEPDFLVQPSRLVQFEIENPAFDPDVSLIFERDLEGLRAAPNEEFADIVRLSQPRVTMTQEGNVRVSRIGTKAAITTRSGLTVGPQVHYFMDLSVIEAVPETIELQTLNLPNDSNTIVDDLLAHTTFIDPTNAATLHYEESDIYDALPESFDNTQLVLSTNEEGESLVFPAFTESGLKTIFVPGFGSILKTSPTIPPSSVIFSNDTDTFLLHVADINLDYDLHPALLPRKRRRLDAF